MICIKCQKEIPDGAHFCQFCGRDQTKQIAKRTRANGTGCAYKRGKTWTAQVVLGRRIVDGKTRYVLARKGGFRTKTEALAYIPTLQAKPKKIAPTLDELWTRFSAGPMLKLSKSQQDKYKIAWARWKPLQWQAIDVLTTGDLQEIVDDATETYYPAKDMRDLMSKLYQLALPDQFVPANLARYIDLPDLEEAEPMPFTDDEITAFWADYAAGNTFTGYILLMIYSGMMPGELLACRKDMIDLDRQQIFRAGLKTRMRKQTSLLIAGFMLPVVEDLLAFSPGAKLLTMNKDRFYKDYYATLERLGLRKLPPYSCRHTTATALALENVAPSVVQKVMRHASFRTTQRYIHVGMDPQLEALAVLDPAAKAKKADPEE